MSVVPWALTAVVACGVLSGPQAVAHAPHKDLTASPIAGAGIDCGGVPQITSRPDLRLWNYDSAVTSCANAVAILDAFRAAAQKYATVGEWECGIYGAAEAERTGIILRCVGPRGPLNALQVEAPV